MKIDRIKDYGYIAGWTTLVVSASAVSLVLIRDVALLAKKAFSDMKFSSNKRISALTFLGVWSIMLSMFHLLEIFSNRVARTYYYGRNHPSIQPIRWTVYPPFIYLQ